jgi:A/G-specific adenine glycosylase
LVLTKQEICLGGTTNPYAIWLSEIMLQQTRVAQGTPYFSLSAAFPYCFDLAEANEEEVLKLWQDSVITRARNLHKTIRSLGVSRCFPDNYSDLLKLKSW